MKADLFLRFNSAEERREFGGSDFIEIQHCALPIGAPMLKIVASDAITHWNLSSLYVYGDNAATFCTEYGEIVDDGLYANLQEGKVDVCGLNYYSPDKAKAMIEKLKRLKPMGYEAFLDWLMENANFNGFYILGV